MARDARGHGSNARNSPSGKGSWTPLTQGARFSGLALGGKDTTVARMRSQLANTGPGHKAGLLQGIRNFLGGK